MQRKSHQYFAQRTSCVLERYNRRLNVRYTNRRPLAVVDRSVDGLE